MSRTVLSTGQSVIVAVDGQKYLPGMRGLTLWVFSNTSSG